MIGTVAESVGIALVVAGMAWIWPPLGLISLGAFMIAIGYLRG